MLCRREPRRALREMGMRKTISRALLRLARSPRMKSILRWVMTHASFALPVERVRETETLLAFYHPRPLYPVHILLVPKEPFGDLMDVPLEGSGFLGELLDTVQVLVREHGLEEEGYQLIINGGAHQDVPHLHVHLVSGVGEETGCPR
jgi:histidine triad (HIT) family protein